MTLPSIEASLCVTTPAFVRKLARASHWGHATDGLPQRVTHAMGEVFRPEDDDGYSVYRVEKDEDLQRVALGLNANRSSLTEELVLVAFPITEIEACGGIDLAPSPGQTKCTGANKCHYDLTADRARLEILCRNAMVAGRGFARLKKAAMMAIVEKARQDGCRAVVEDSTHCVCDDE